MMILIYGLLGFVFLVFVHELGHFAVARAFGIQVDEFAVGMGPTIIQKKFKGTMYKLCIIPLGGYCAIKGQSDFGTTERNKDSDSFFGKSAFARFCVVGAGPLFSFLLGYFLLTAAISINGETRLSYTVLDPPKNSQFFKSGDKVLEINGQKTQYWDQIHMILLKNLGETNTIIVERDGRPFTVENYIFNPSEKNLPDSDFFSYKKTGPVIVTSTKKDSPAEQMGLIFGDIIRTANGKMITTDRDLNDIVKNSTGPIKLVIHRYKDVKNLAQKDHNFFNNKIYPYDTISLNVGTMTSKDRKILGINLYVFEGNDISSHWKHENISFVNSLSLGWTKSWDMLSINAKAISQLLQGNKEIRESLSGPVKIFHEVGRITQAYGFVTFLSFIGTISLALAFFNLLPFPALDGGHMLIAVIEAIIRRPINAKILNTLQIIGVLLLLTMFVFVTIKDIGDLFG